MVRLLDKFLVYMVQCIYFRNQIILIFVLVIVVVVTKRQTNFKSTTIHKINLGVETNTHEEIEFIMLAYYKKISNKRICFDFSIFLSLYK